MRVFSAALATETNTFAPMPTGLASFHERGYYKAGKHPDHLSFFAGPLWAARQRGKAQGWTLLEGLVAAAQPGGITTRAAYEALRDELLADLQAALPIDMVLLGLHGAMVADGCDDCEGDLLQRVRAIVGPKVVVGAELDPHNHLSAAMVESADLLVAFKEYPHTDILERALELVDLCQAQAEGRIAPVASVVDTGGLVMMHTSRQPARGFVDRLMALEGHDGILSISISHGFPWGDVPDMGTQVLVYSDAKADPGAAKGKALARRLADELSELRHALAVPQPGIDTALDEALAFDDGPVVLADGADNPGGGAPGDSTFILRRLLERGIGNACLGPAVGSDRRAHRLRSRRRRALEPAHRRQDRPAVGRPAGPASQREGAASRHVDDRAVEHADRIGRLRAGGSRWRADRADQRAQPGDEHRPVHPPRRGSGREEDHRPQVLAALLRIVLDGGEEGHLRRRAGRGDAGPEDAAVQEDPPAEVADRLNRSRRAD